MSYSEKKLIMILILVTAISIPYLFSNKSIAMDANIQITETEKEQYVLNNKLRHLDLSARAIAVFDLTTDSLIYGKNENMILPLASITKVMTAIVALENMSASTLIEVSQTALDQDGGQGLRKGEKWILSDLVKFMLVSSSNDGAYAVALNTEGRVGGSQVTGVEFFIKSMNKKALDLGLANTTFFNPTGLDIDESKPGATSTAVDVAKMMIYAFTKHPLVFESTSKNEIKLESFDEKKHNAKNTNSSVGETFGLFSSKTGFTDLAGGNLVVLTEIGPVHPVAVVVLGSSKEDRFSDVRKIVDVLVGL